MWPMLITSFFLLIFLQPIPFFRLPYSFFFWSHAPLIYVFYLADTSSSYYMHLLFANARHKKIPLQLYQKSYASQEKPFVFIIFLWISYICYASTYKHKKVIHNYIINRNLYTYLSTKILRFSKKLLILKAFGIGNNCG